MYENYTESLIFTIKRDENANAGYSIACITIGNSEELIVINSIDETGPAYKAGLRKLHIGWNIISVNDINTCKTEKILEILESTKKNNNKFTIEIQPIFEINSDNDLTLKSCLDI